MRFKTVAIIIIAFLVTGCVKPILMTSYNDNDIDKEIIQEIEDLTKKIFSSISDGNLDELEKAFYLEKKQKVEEMDLTSFLDFQPMINNNPHLEQHTYTESNASSVTVFFPDMNGYIATLPSDGNNVFTSFYTIDHDSNKYLLMLNFLLNENDDWKLSKMYVGNYEMMDKNIEAWLKQSMEFRNDEKLIPAYFSHYISTMLVRPNEFMNFLDITDIQDDFNELHVEVSNKYQFPMKIQMGEEKIEIYRLDILPTNQGIVYHVQYVTNKDVDTVTEVEMKEEALEIEKELKKKMKGFGEGLAKTVLYTATSEPPLDPQLEYSAYTVEVEQD